MDARAVIDSRKKLISASDLGRLRRRLVTHVDLIEEKSFDLDFVQLAVARKVATALTALLDMADGFDSDQRATLGAAIDYFILTDDEENDLTSPVGMVDDAEVANAACEMLGRPDLKVQLA